MIQNFDQNGYLIIDHENNNSYKELTEIVEESIKISVKNICGKDLKSLSKFHETVNNINVNEVRMHSYNLINSFPNLHDLCFSLIKNQINKLLGPDLAVQLKVNLSIVPPHDKSSIIPLHSDINTGESIHQLVSWIPFTKCYSSNSLFITDLKESLKLHKNLAILNKPNRPTISEYAELHLKPKYLNMNTNQNLIFTPIMYHGSNTNLTKDTRVSINYRLKNLFSPYLHHDCEGKSLSTFYKRYKISKLTEVTDSYKKPIFS